MTILHARVKNGRVVVDDPTDLPEGSKVDLLLLDADTEWPADERIAIDASIRRGLEQADREELLSVEEVLTRLRSV